MPRLTVRKGKTEEVYRDFVRVPEVHRRDERGRTIIEGEICRILGTPKKSFAILRGNLDCNVPDILMDERTRNALGACLDQEYDFQFKRVSVFGQIRWAWNASEIGYRIATRLAVVALLLGILGFVPTLVRLADWILGRT